MQQNLTFAQRYSKFKKYASTRLYNYLEFLYYFKNRYLLCFLFGVLGGVGMTPFNIFPCFVFSIFSIIRLCDFCNNAKKCFFAGVCYFFGLSLIVFYWIPFSLLTDKHYFYLFPFALVLLPFAYALLHAPMFALYKEVSYYTNAVERVLFFPAVWCIFEYIRSFTFLAFPWALSGYTMMFSMKIFQFASIIGVFGFSVFIMFFASACQLIFLDGDGYKYYGYLRYILTLFAIMLLMYLFGWFATSGRARQQKFEPNVILRVVQGGQKAFAYKNELQRERALANYKQITQSSPATNVTHIIWPESAVEFSVYQNEGVANILQNMLTSGQILLTGSVRIEEEALSNYLTETSESAEGIDNINNLKIYNTMSMIDSLGRQTYYDKHYLVPFGEFIPFKNLIPFLQAITGGGIDFSRGKELRVYKLINTPSFLPLICYEIAFSGKFPFYSSIAYKNENGIERIKRERLRWIVNITNDAWFGYTSGPFQHFQMARARAVEYGVSVVRAANTGISGIIDPHGKVIKKINLNKTGFFDSPLPSPLESETIFSIVGNLPAIILVLVIFTSLIIHYLINKHYKKLIPLTTQLFNAIDKACGNTRDKRGD